MAQRFQWFAITLAIVMLAGVASAQTAFRWNVKEGDEFEVVLDQSDLLTMNVGERTIEAPKQLVLKMRWKVKDVEEEKFTLTQTIEQTQLKMVAPGVGEIEYDSSDKAPPEGVAAKIAESFKPLIGASFEQVMNKRGKVLEVNIPDDAQGRINKNPTLKSLFSKKTMTQTFSQSSIELPAEAIEPGDKWTQASENKTPAGVMKLTNEYELLGEKKVDGATVAEFDVAAKLEFVADDKNPLAPKLTLTDQKFEGKFYFDQAAGHMTASNVNLKFETDVRVQNQSLKQVVESRFEITVTPVDQ